MSAMGLRIDKLEEGYVSDDANKGGEDELHPEQAAYQKESLRNKMNRH